jgi:endonuclease/exonuclease/phosphatase family metal-dependent hydrolase
MKRYLLLPLLLLSAAITQAQNTVPIRIATYNVLNFGDTEDPARVDALTTVIEKIQPDILVVQDIVGNDAQVDFEREIVLQLVGLHLSEAEFADGTGDDNAMYYDTTKLDLLGTVRRATAGRDISGWILLKRSSRDTLYVYTMQFQGDQGTANELKRLAEAEILRAHLDSLPRNAQVIVAGDLNVYTSREEAYRTLLQVGIVAAGEVVDPIDQPGDWHAN